MTLPFMLVRPRHANAADPEQIGRALRLVTTQRLAATALCDPPRSTVITQRRGLDAAPQA